MCLTGTAAVTFCSAWSHPPIHGNTNTCGHRDDLLDGYPHLTKEEKAACFRDFEQQMGSVCNNHCLWCKRVGLTVTMSRQKNKCSQCYNARRADMYFVTNHSIPVWYDDLGIPQFHIPEELQDLREAEKFLIQLASTFVPLQHVKNGTLGLKGHVCCFPQETKTFSKILPRFPMETEILRVVQRLRADIGGEDTVQREFLVRRRKVLSALVWLKRYNHLYSDIIIEESNLNWMGDRDEACLNALTLNCPDMEGTFDGPITEDNGPAKAQAIAPRDNGTDITAIGVITEDEPTVLSEGDETIQLELRKSLRNAKKGGKPVRINWPTIGATAVSEYEPTIKVFCLAFPWLFPGGYGDASDYYNGNAADWGRHMLLYEDGRFARDKYFCFYAMNYIIRRQNQKHGRWFVDGFMKNCAPTLDDLKDEIAKGNDQFINTLHYFSQKVRGSSSFWLDKRSELYSWINHHIDHGNGPPMFFITLSCAEYFWPDVIRLLKQRTELAGQNWDELTPNSTGLVQLVNDYSIVIQEYFQRRVETYLNTVGSALLGIEHYWVRYEFAPGRGQIHAHLVATSKDRHLYSAMREDYAVNPKKRVARLAAYASARFGLTATVSADFDDMIVRKGEDAAVATLFSDVPNDATSQLDDIEQLKKYVELHECSGFCLRRYVRMSFGYYSAAI